MHANYTNKRGLIYPELSYLITGICFEIHNGLGRFAREKQYGDLLEAKLKEKALSFQREVRMSPLGNIIDFIIDNKILLELKSKPFTTMEDYYQIQRYLQSKGLKLGLLINFRNRYLKPKRILRLDTDTRLKFT